MKVTKFIYPYINFYIHYELPKFFFYGFQLDYNFSSNIRYENRENKTIHRHRATAQLVSFLGER